MSTYCQTGCSSIRRLKNPAIGGSDINDKLIGELILSLEPDLALAANITPSEQLKTLEDLGITVFMLPNPAILHGLEQFEKMIMQDFSE